MNEPLRLMAVLAHPDDESLGVGGTLAKYAAEGVETYLITATRGEAGRFRGHRAGDLHPGPEALARIREGELRAAVSTLGIRELSLLDYRDGALDQADAREAIGRIAGHVRRLRPQVVLTFAFEGSYGHPDHIAISQFTTAAMVVAAAADDTGGGAVAPHQVSKLYYMAWPEPVMAAYQAAFKKLTSMVDGVERQASPWPEWAPTTVIDTRGHVATAWRAVACHDSQIAGYQGLMQLSPEQHEEVWGRQYYYRAYSTVNGGRRRESDLFEGLREASRQ